AAGHEVVVASQPALMPTVAATGLPAVPLGYDHAMALVSRRADPEGEAVLRSLALKHRPWDLSDEELEAGHRDLVLGLLRIVNAPLVDGLVGFCRRWCPDLVVWEP
ncbi:activator-dependent family glycosyltransferase, partial [Nocardiopsis changdeensis]